MKYLNRMTRKAGHASRAESRQSTPKQGDASYDELLGDQEIQSIMLHDSGIRDRITDIIAAPEYDGPRVFFRGIYKKARN